MGYKNNILLVVAIKKIPNQLQRKGLWVLYVNYKGYADSTSITITSVTPLADTVIDINIFDGLPASNKCLVMHMCVYPFGIFKRFLVMSILPLFLRYSDWILELFRQCGIYRYFIDSMVVY